MNSTQSKIEDVTNILTVQEAYVHLDGEFHFTFINRAAEILLRAPRADLIGKTPWEVYPESAATPLEEGFRRAKFENAILSFENYYEPWQRWYTITAVPDSSGGLVVHFLDISERKRVDEALQQVSEALAKAEGHYRIIFNCGSDSVFVLKLGTDGLPGEFIEVNDNACRYLGYSREELLRMRVSDIDEHPDIPGTMRSLLVEGHLIWEGIHVAKQGRRIPVEMNARICNLDGTPAMICAVRDISKRKEAEERYREIFDGALEGICRISTEKRLIAANPAMARMLGYDSPRDLVSTSTDTTAQLWVDPNDREHFVALLEEHGTARGFECRFKRKDGTAIWVSINVRSVCGTDGQPLYYDGFVQDISEGRRMEDALRKSEEKFSRAFQSSPAALTIADLATGSYLEVNGAFEQITGYRRDEVVGRRWDELGLWADSPNRDEAVGRLVRDGSLRNVEFRFRKKGGEPGTGLLSAELIEINGKPCAITATIDITEHLQLENQLRQAQKLESVGRLAGGVAHDFNNLLTVINGYSGMLLEKLKVFDPLHPYVLEIKNAGDRAASLTKQLLAFSRKQVIQPRAFDLNTTIRQSASILQRLIGEDIALETHLDDSLGQVLADPHQIHQVIMNLAVNARDAMPDGGRLDIETQNVELGAEATTAEHPDAVPGSYILMTATDSGHGMDETTRHQIFEPFFTTKEVGKGTGLGLATVYGIIRQSGGWVDVWSEVGVGTTLKVYLPRTDVRPVPGERGIGVAAENGNETILVVEDEKSVRSFTVAALKRYGYHVIEASDGDEAIAVAEQHSGRIQLLLTDVIMPGMNGKVLSERLKKSYPDLKVLLTSGYTADAFADRGVIDLGDAFLHKPFASEELAGKVRAVLMKPSLESPAGN